MSKKKSPKSYWNYRVLTKEKNGNRSFFIAEVYYHNEKVNGYIESGILNGYESKKDLKLSYKLIKRAFKYPILDADKNFKKFKKK